MSALLLQSKLSLFDELLRPDDITYLAEWSPKYSAGETDSGSIIACPLSTGGEAISVILQFCFYELNKPEPVEIILALKAVYQQVR